MPAPTQDDAPAVVARPPEFPEAIPNPTTSAIGSLNQLLDVSVTVTAELGRIRLPISKVLHLGLGSILELNRTTSEAVDLLVQGVPLARGEIVVVDDRYAIRIKEIVDPKMKK